MRRFGSSQFISASVLRWAVGVRRPTCRLAPIFVVALIIAAFGCREDTESPTGPEIEPALKTDRIRALPFRQISAGWVHTCGVTRDNLAYCWARISGASSAKGRPLTV